MNLAGLQKLSLLDFPEKICATVFTAGCNMRCPFCHNASLVVGKTPEQISEDEFFAFLNKRLRLLDGVCITGGEPLLQKDIDVFISKIKALGFAVKLDTNGTSPEKLDELIRSGHVDYVAMDIKNSVEKYPLTVGIPGFDTAGVEKSMDILLRGDVPYEFRTTLVRQFHTPEDISAAARRIAGARAYYLQTFKDSGDLIGENLSGFSAAETEHFADSAREYVNNVYIRGE